MKNFLFKTLSKFSILILILAVVLLSILTIHFNFFELKTKIYEKYPNLSLRKNLFKEESITNNLMNDYNIKFPPYTQFFRIKLKKKKLVFDKEYYTKGQISDPSIAYTQYGTFFIETYKNKLIVSDYLGNIYYLDNLKKTISDRRKKFKLTKIKSDLEVIRVFDSLIYNGKLYVAFIDKKNGCKKINISFANLNINSLKFKKFFSPNECSETGGLGRMQFYIHEDEPGILVSTEEGIHDKPGVNAQNDNSVFGKIIFINLKNSKYINFSKGHRVVQGLYANKDLILASEHGPRGGDEINRIIFKKNYGWPIASYGERYDFNYETKPYYKKNHESYDFEEPIYATTQGIGISEILMLPKSFSNFFSNDILIISSLAGKSIYFALMDKNFSRVITLEKVFLNERIRDLKYNIESNSILLALEENGEIGILSSEN